MEDCVTLITNLKAVLRNLKKAPNRKYRAQTLKIKLKTSRENYEKIIDLISELKDEEEQKIIANSARNLLLEIITFINDKLQYKTLIPFKTISQCIRILLALYIRHKSSPNNPSSSILVSTMAKVDIKLGASLISVYDGNSDTLDTFIDAATFFIDYVNAENEGATPIIKESAKILTAKFLKTRLTGIAHSSVQGIEKVEEMFTALRLRCASKVNSDNLLAKLKNCKEKQSLEGFCSEVEQTCALLQNMFIKESIPPTKAAQMSTKVGVDTLINGVKNPDTKLILKAGNFSSINEAIQKVVENGTSSESPRSNIFYISNRTRYPNNQRSNRYRNTSRRNNFQARNNNSQNNFSKNPNNRINYQRENSNYRNNSHNYASNTNRSCNSSRNNRRNWNSQNTDNAAHRNNNVLLTETQANPDNRDSQNSNQAFLDQSQRQFIQ